MRDLQIWQRKNLRDFFKKEIKVPNEDLEAFNYFKELGKQCQCDYWRGLNLHCKKQCADLTSVSIDNAKIGKFNKIQQSYIAYYKALSRICEKKLNELGGVR